MSLIESKLYDLKLNPVTLFGRDWALLTAGNKENGYNTMTIAWGQLGAVWDRSTAQGKIIIPTTTVFVRPQRYTKEFMEREAWFTVSFFAPEYKKALGYLGSHSGRDGDKISEAGLTPIFTDGTTYFEQANLVFVCRKLYQAPLLESGFADRVVMEKNYPNRDFHEMYVGEIVKVYADKEEDGGVGDA